MASISDLLSIHSAGVSVLSQQVSALSQAVSIISVQVASALSIANAASNAASVVSQALSNEISNRISADNAVSAQAASANSVLNANEVSLASDVGRISLNVSVISAGLGEMQMRVTGANQLVSGAIAGTITAISGLSVSVAAGGIYQLEAGFLWAAPAGQAVGFGMSFPAMAKAAGRWVANISVPAAGVGGLSTTVAMAGWFTEADTGVIRASATNGAAGVTWHASMDGLFVVSAAGTIQLQTRVSAAATTIYKGAFLRAFKVG